MPAGGLAPPGLPILPGVRAGPGIAASSRKTTELNVNSLGAKSVLKADGSTLGVGDLLADQIAVVIFDGPEDAFRLINPATTGGGGGGVTGYLKVKEDLFGAIADQDWDEHVSDGEWHGLLYGRSGADSAWVDATSAVYTVPTGKKALVVQFGGDRMVAYKDHSGVVEGRLRNTTDSTDLLVPAHFRDVGAGGDFLSSDYKIEVAAGKTFKLGIYVRNDLTRSGAAWVIFKVVDA